MTQIFTGTGLGLTGSSVTQLGGYGVKGESRVGQLGLSVSVNAASGNVVLTQMDGFLSEHGVGFGLSQSYNSSLGRWQFNVESGLSITGDVNTDGSVVTRRDEDGHESRLVFDTRLRAYVAEDGRPVRLSCNGLRWLYQEGCGTRYCCYALDGRLSELGDRDGHVLRLEYDERGQLSRMRDEGGEQSIRWQMTDGLVTEVVIERLGVVVQHLVYEYDAEHRLRYMERALGDGGRAWVAFEYWKDSTLISDIRESDGVSVHLDFDATGRLTRLVDGEGRVTGYEYYDGRTVVTQGEHSSWTYYYDTDSRLTGIDGAENTRIRYRYAGQHLKSVIQGSERWLFDYNDAGDCIRTESPSGEVIERGFDDWHRMWYERRYQAFNGDATSCQPQTQRFVYDAQGHLRFHLAFNGVVTEHRYDTDGNRMSSRCYLSARWDDSTDDIIAWCAIQSPQDISLSEYHYDTRGCLIETCQYTQVDAMGCGILTADAKHTYSTYDASARLTTQSQVMPSGERSTTYFLYDALGRLVRTIDNQGHTQTIEYDDVHQRRVTTDANGLCSISLYDKSGLLLSTHRLDESHDYGIARYQYDNAGRLMLETNASGESVRLGYDAEGRVSVRVSASGHVTAYEYNEEGDCVLTRAYQEPLALPTDESGAISDRLPTASQADRITQVIYNEHHQLTYRIDAEGFVIAYRYDGFGRVIEKTAYAAGLNREALNTRLSLHDVVLVESLDDRTVTYYYDALGQLRAEVTGDGAATAFRYDALGHVIETHRYHNRVTHRTGHWEDDAPDIDDNDIHTYSLFNRAGLKIADRDAEGYVTEYRYDARGLMIEQIAYANQSPSHTGTFEDWRPIASGHDHHTMYQYNDLNQLIETSSHTGLITSYEYDSQGRVTQETRTDRRTLEARRVRHRYDGLGRIIQSLDASGVALLESSSRLTPDSIEAIWQAHSVRYTYDLSGRLLTETNALNDTTRMVYNEAGLLSYCISACGLVTETRYNAFGQVAESIRYAVAYTQADVSCSAIQSAMSAYADDLQNDITQYEYNALGQLISTQTGTNKHTIRYTAFGERAQDVSVQVTTDYAYDHQGLLVEKTVIGNGLMQKTAIQYDSFGRIKTEWDVRDNATTYTLNKRGERLVSETSTHHKKESQYDAFGREVSNIGAVSVAYAYDDATQTVTLTHNGTESRVMTQFNAFGDKLTVTDANEHTTTYHYDARGLLVRVERPEGSTQDNTYDAAGRLTLQLDEGCVHQFTYDPEGRLLTRITDPNGLALTTSHRYDVLGRELELIEAGCCTRFRYDAQGRLIERCQDPDGLNLITRHEYDEANQVIRTVVSNPEGVNRITAYTWDALGRCTSKTQDPDGLALTTRYGYEVGNNVTRETDANGHTTQFIYDLNGALRYRVDARGFVTEHRYDTNGHEVQTSAYAHPIEGMNGTLTDSSIEALIHADPTKDQHQFRAFDTQGRVMVAFDAMGYATRFRYDGNDNITDIIAYDTPCSLTELLNTGYSEPVDSGNTRHTRMSYDGLNREQFRMNASGYVTQSRYTADGLLIEQTRFATPVTGLSQAQSIESHLRPNALKDETTRFAYDAAGRMTAHLSAEGCVTTFEYDAAGHQTLSRKHAIALTAEEQSSASWYDTISLSTNDRLTQSLYDAAGRERFRLTPGGVCLERRYDAVGNVVAEFKNTRLVTDFTYDALGRLLTQTESSGQTLRYTYDASGNVTTKKDSHHLTQLYVYNELNQLIELSEPDGSFTSECNGFWRDEPCTRITRHSYDAFGNTIATTLDVGDIKQTRRFEFDANNHLRETQFIDVRVDDVWQTVTESQYYNAFGEVIESRDRAGHSRFTVRNTIGLPVYVIDAEGSVTGYDYDGFENRIRKTRYATALPSSVTIDPKDTDAIQVEMSKRDRHETCIYDKDHRLTIQRQDVMISYNPKTETYATLAPETRWIYTAFGEIATQSIRLSDDDWATTEHLYDTKGLITATLNAERYLSTYGYNEDGLQTEETHYATRATNITTPPAASDKDRRVSRTYNAQGQLMTQTLREVQVSRLTGDAAGYDTLTRDLVSTYSYDALGHLVRTTDAEGGSSYAYYNAEGQLTAKVGASTPSGRPAVTYRYDAQGMLVESHAWANGASVATETGFLLQDASISDIIQQDRYDNWGHLIEAIDGNGNSTHYRYDVSGNVSRTWRLLHRADNSTWISEQYYTYDHEQRLTQTATLLMTGLCTTEDVRYNAFGEVAQKGTDGVFGVFCHYDKAGRVWRSNTQGHTQINVYDLTNNVTQVVTSTNARPTDHEEEGFDLSIDYYENVVRYVADLHHFQRQDNSYDALGHLIGQRQDAGRKYRPDAVVPRVSLKQVSDRWGNILQHTNANGYTTHYEYNGLNGLIRQILPEVQVMDEHGIVRTCAPIIEYAIDGLGRTIAMRDANGHTVAHRFDAEGRITQDIDAKGNHRDKTYDLFGRLSQTTNERGHVTAYTYDHSNHLLSVSTQNTLQQNTYDEAGHLIHQIAASGIEKTMSYDEMGNIMGEVSGKTAKRYEYDHQGHKIAEIDNNGNRPTWRYNEKGYLVEHTDLGGHTFQYTYNINGLLTDETSSSGKHIRYYYLSNGQVASFEDLTRWEIARYTYDDSGNVITKSSTRPAGWTHQEEVYQYDALNRLSNMRRAEGVHADGITTSALAVDYAFDAAGNIRYTSVTAKYEGYSPVTQQQYFTYDENNRMLVNKGALVNGVIDITRTQGTRLSYDSAGNIHDAYSYQVALYHYVYDYNEECQLTRIGLNASDLKRMKYTNGLLQDERLFSGNMLLKTNHFSYQNGIVTGQVTYNATGQERGRTSYFYDATGTNMTYIDSWGIADNGLRYTQTNRYTYVLWDGYLRKEDIAIRTMPGYATATAVSTQVYDENGLLDKVIDSPTQTNTTTYYTSLIDGIKARKDGRSETSYLTFNGKTIGDFRLEDYTSTQTLTLYGGFSPTGDEQARRAGMGFIGAAMTLGLSSTAAFLALTLANPDSAQTPQDTPGTYCLQAGDTLESVALQLYGDSSLWYLLADANGITDRYSSTGEKGGQLQTGMRLIIPPTARGQHHTSQTHALMSLTDWTGNTSATIGRMALMPPTAPPAPHKHGHPFWRAVATIAIVTLASAAMLMTAGAAALVAGAHLSGSGMLGLASLGASALGGSAGLSLLPTLSIGLASGFASNLTGQVAAVLMNQQHGLDLNSALITAAATGAVAGINHLMNTMPAYQPIRDKLQALSSDAFNTKAAAEMMTRDMANQALNKELFDQQRKLDWKELAVSGITAGLMTSTTAQHWNTTLNKTLGKPAGFLNAQTEALIKGTLSGKTNTGSLLQDNLGSALVEGIMTPETPHSSDTASITETQDIEVGAYCPIPEGENGNIQPSVNSSKEEWDKQIRYQLLKAKFDANADYMKMMATQANPESKSSTLTISREDLKNTTQYPLVIPISDAEFTDKDSLTQTQIKDIIMAKNPDLVNIYNAQNHVFNTAQKYRINPKILLASLQQEQSWGLNGRINKVMGIGLEGKPEDLSFGISIDKGGATYRRWFDEGMRNLQINKVNTLIINHGFHYIARTAGEYSKLKYTPWTYYEPQKSRPYDQWVTNIRNF